MERMASSSSEEKAPCPSRRRTDESGAWVDSETPPEQTFQEYYDRLQGLSLAEIQAEIVKMYEEWGGNERHRLVSDEPESERLSKYLHELTHDRYPGPLAAPVDQIVATNMKHNDKILVLNMCYYQKNPTAKVDEQTETARQLNTLFLRSRYLQITRESITLYLQVVLVFYFCFIFVFRRPFSHRSKRPGLHSKASNKSQSPASTKSARFSAQWITCCLRRSSSISNTMRIV